MHLLPSWDVGSWGAITAMGLYRVKKRRQPQRDNYSLPNLHSEVTAWSRGEGTPTFLRARHYGGWALYRYHSVQSSLCTDAKVAS